MFDDRTFAAVLFDMDGTLIDSAAAVERSWRRWGSEFGVVMNGFAGWHGVPAVQVIARLLPAERVAAGLARIEEIEVADTDGIVVLPGVVDVLDSLPPGRAAIVTSCTAPLATARIEATGLRAPEVLVTADQVTVGKPDPAPYLLAAQRLGVAPGDCLVVEDAPAGLTSARAAGCATLAVTTTHPAAELDADVVVDRLTAVRFDAGPAGVRISDVAGL